MLKGDDIAAIDPLIFCYDFAINVEPVSQGRPESSRTNRVRQRLPMRQARHTGTLEGVHLDQTDPITQYARAQDHAERLDAAIADKRQVQRVSETKVVAEGSVMQQGRKRDSGWRLAPDVRFDPECS